MRELRVKKIAVSAAVCFSLFCLLSGCGMFGKSCEELSAELQELYDGFMDDTADLSETQILERCSVVLEQCPDLPIAWELTGLLHWENDRMKEALANYKNAVSFSPEDEELIEDAMIVAFEARKEYLSVSDDGKVKTKPFSKITLAEYAQTPTDIRLQWCEFSLDKGLRPATESQELKNREGEAGGTVSAEVASSLKTPQDLDFALLNQARKDTEAVLFKATTDQMVRHTSINGTQELK